MARQSRSRGRENWASRVSASAFSRRPTSVSFVKANTSSSTTSTVSECAGAGRWTPSHTFTFGRSSAAASDIRGTAAAVSWAWNPLRVCPEAVCWPPLSMAPRRHCRPAAAFMSRSPSNLSSSRRGPARFALTNDNVLVRRDCFPSVNAAGGPANGQLIHLRGSPQSEMEPEVILRQIAPSAADFIHLHRGSASNLQPRANSVAVRCRAYGSDSQPVTCRRSVRHQQRRRLVQLIHGHAQTAVVQNVANGRTSAGMQCRERGTRMGADIFETPIAQVVVQQFPLPEMRIAAGGVDFGCEMAVDDQDIRPRVVVVVEEQRAPAQITAQAA